MTKRKQSLQHFHFMNAKPTKAIHLVNRQLKCDGVDEAHQVETNASQSSTDFNYSDCHIVPSSPRVVIG
jgi:hypothetical protein